MRYTKCSASSSVSSCACGCAPSSAARPQPTSGTLGGCPKPTASARREARHPLLPLRDAGRSAQGQRHTARRGAGLLRDLRANLVIDCKFYFMPKLVEISDPERPTIESVLQPPSLEELRARIEAATFTGKGDIDTVIEMLDDFDRMLKGGLTSDQQSKTLGARAVHQTKTLGARAVQKTSFLFDAVQRAVRLVCLPAERGDSHADADASRRSLTRRGVATARPQSVRSNCQPQLLLIALIHAPATVV